MSIPSDHILFQTNTSIRPPETISPNPKGVKRIYNDLFQQSITNPEMFWAEIAAKDLEWFRPWQQTYVWDFPSYKWFVGGQLNITHNCLDRHIILGNGSRIAYYYTNEDNEEASITYQDLLALVCQIANTLKGLGIKKRDRVIFYLPLTIEAIASILACARIGAIHSVVFAGFGANALRVRTEDAQAKIVITASSTKRRGQRKDLKATVDEAVKGLDFVEHIIVLNRKEDSLSLHDKELDFYQEVSKQPTFCEAEIMDAEDPLFILYTSGTTGTPKGILHTVGGYSVFTHYTTRVVFDVQNTDIYWCTADIGWITGHSYVVYGPLSNGMTSVIMEGAPDYPDPGRWWSLIDKFQVSIFYTAPTAIRMFMKFGPTYPARYNLASLRILGSVGEPINPEAWLWYYQNIGHEKTAVVDTWWQTETGGHAIVTLPQLPQKPGKAGLPFYGIEADVVDKDGKTCPPDTVGNLVIKKPWPGALRTCWNDPERFSQYWTKMNHFYSPGDLATKDKDGYIMILGRSDDVLKIAGHRIGTAEVESALVSHPAVAEAAVIGKPDEIKGEKIKAFVILKLGTQPKEELSVELQNHVRKELGVMAYPEEIAFVDKLPKTRSGKIMRRVLKAQELGMDVGDITTLEE